MTDFQAIVEDTLNGDNVEDSEMDTNIDRFLHWQRICAAGTAAMSAGCVALLQLNATSDQAMPDVSCSQPSTGSGKSKNKLKAAADFEHQIVSKNIAASLEHVSRALVESAETLANKVPRPHPSSAELFNALHSLDLPLEYLLECYEFLSKDDAKAEKFLCAHEQYRALMLTRIMNSR